MLHAVRVSRVRACLLIGSVALLIATAGACDAGAYQSRVAGASHAHKARCGAARPSRSQGGSKHRAAGKSCLVKKSKRSIPKRRIPKKSRSWHPFASTPLGLGPNLSSRLLSGLSSSPNKPVATSPPVVPSEPGKPSEPGPASTEYGDSPPYEEDQIAPPNEEGQIAPPVEESQSTTPIEENQITPPTEGGSSGGSPTESPPEQPEEPAPPPTPPFRFFSPSSFWNQALPPDAELDSNSSAIVNDFDQIIAAEQVAGTGPWIGTTDYSVPLYTVSADQPTVAVKLAHTPEAALSEAWSAVPLPTTAKPATGHDGNLVVWQPSTDKLWEFWQISHTLEGWQASWGGAIDNVSSSSGIFGSGAWPGAEPWWGVSASSLSIAGGLITFEDLERGKIEHTLAMAIPGVRAGVYSSPALRTDGKSANPLALPEGAHLRLNPNLDLSTLHLPKMTLMIAEAAQRYGIVIRDGAGNIQFFGQDPSSLPTNPYRGPTGYFEGQSPVRLLASFPWQELQLLKMELHSAK